MPQIENLKNTVKQYVKNVSKRFIRGCETFMGVSIMLYKEIHAMELLFIRLPNLYPFACQLLFFLLCEMVLHDTPTKANTAKFVGALTTILLYSIVGYFVARIRNMYNHRGSSPTPSTSLRGFRNYLKWVLKMVVEWAKAVMIAICLREQGMSYQLEKSYTLVTLSYYICTENMFLRVIASGLSFLCLDVLDNMEFLYVAIVLHSYAIVITVIFTCLLLNTKYANFALSASYFTLYLRVKDLYCHNYKLFVLEKKTYASFKKATEQDLRDWNDICAVCLNSMSRARITPCRHLFHPHCLKQCLQVSFQCPLCKQNFLN